MKFADSTIKKYLYQPGAVFEIPEFQRPYTWKTVNAQEYLKDLEECVSTGKGHYFGTVVQVEDEDGDDAYSIIDGQQRVTTSLLLIFSIYHLVKKDPALLGEGETTTEDILDNYLINKNRKNNRIKLRTVTTDNEILQHIFDSNGDASELSDKDKLSNLYTVYSVFREYFSKKEDLSKYINGLRHFKIVSITLEQGDDNPQRVFESINSTGEPLSDGDKIRNFSLMLNSKESRNHVYQEYWKPLERTLTDVNRDNITDFFRYYLISKRQANVKLPEVYSAFKDEFENAVGKEQSREALDEFYGDIKRSLRFYKLLRLIDTNQINKNNEEWSRYIGIAETIFKMRYIRVDLYIPFAISVLAYHDDGELTDEQLIDVFKLIESYFSRRIIVNFYTTSVDRLMSSLHKQTLNYIKRDPSADYVDVLKYIILNETGQTRIPNDIEYEKAIRTYPFYEQHGGNIRSYVLSALDSSNKEAKSTLRLIAEDNIDLTVEHVMPQTLSRDEWREMLGSDYERIHNEYLHTLANLTLTGYNSDYSNRPYQEKMVLEIKNKKTGEIKQVGFRFSPLPMNKWIAAHDVWDEDVLMERREMWVNKLQNTWPMPTTSFQPVTGASVDLLDNISLRGENIRSVSVLGEKTTVSTWVEALDVIVDSLFGLYPNMLDTIAHDELLSGFIKNDSTAFRSSIEIGNSELYIATSNNTDTKLNIIRRIATLLNLSSGDIEAEIGVEDDE
jgi:uncharacterized protein with ParB-like and HNH nuclease domain